MYSQWEWPYTNYLIINSEEKVLNIIADDISTHKLFNSLGVALLTTPPFLRAGEKGKERKINDKDKRNMTKSDCRIKCTLTSATIGHRLFELPSHTLIVHERFV